MKSHFDANLSPRLAALVADLYPGSLHVHDVGVGPADEAIWQYAEAHGLTIISKDSDFYRLSMVRGAPPKVVWLRVGNDGTAVIATAIRASTKHFAEFAADATEALLIIDRR